MDWGDSDKGTGREMDGVVERGAPEVPTLIPPHQAVLRVPSPHSPAWGREPQVQPGWGTVFSPS